MNWDSKLDALLTAADDSMAKVKERLYTRGDSTKDFLYDSPSVRRGAAYGDTPAINPASPYTPAINPASPYTPAINPASLYTPAAYTVPVSSEDMVSLSSQLLAQAKMITSLHQAIGRLERDRDLHIQRIQSLEDEVRRLGAPRGPDTSESLLERKMEGLRQELSSELRHLEDRVRDCAPRVSSPSLRSTASVLQEVNETKKMIWKEYESLRRDTDYMHQRLRRQEDDLMRQLSDGQELRRAQEKNTAALDRILSGQHAQTQELERARGDTQGVQRDLLQIRSSIRDLMETVRILEGKVHAYRAPSDRPERRRELSRSQSSSEEDDDLRSRISLADISSEDTSYSFSATTEISPGSREKSSAGRDVKSRRDRDLDDQDLSDLSDSAPELNFSDL